MKSIKKKNTWNKILAVLILLFSIGYDIMPADFVPDIAPLIGWIDDIAITITAIANAYVQWRKRV